MTHHVYARCAGSPTRHPATDGQYLQTEFSGSRSQCETYIKNKVRNYRPTHFNFISKLDHDRATRRYL